MTKPYEDEHAIFEAIDAEARRGWPNDRSGARRFRRYAYRALKVLREAGFDLQPMPPRRPWPHDEPDFHIWRKTDTLPDLDRLKAFLGRMTDKERQAIEVRTGWRNETGDYIHDLLTMREGWDAE